MDDNQMRQDVEFLAGRLLHRGANTENERLAAEYIHERFSAHAPEARIDDFYSINSFHILFASYYVEFLVVALLATWFPWGGLGYGLVVFMLYMAEFTGYPVLRRLLPQYETQNVLARFPVEDHKRLLVVTAHYDSPKETVLRQPGSGRRFWVAQLILVFCMTAILITCAVDGMDILDGSDYRVDIWARWIAVTALLASALTLYTSESNAEYTRGAVCNASGVSVLLYLAERLEQEPLESTEVCLVATGSKETWLSGMHHFVTEAKLERKSTYFLNVAHVGAGMLRYATGEGMMHVFSSAKELLEAARGAAGEYRASQVTYRGLPTDALIPLARGYKALGIVGTGPDGWPMDLGEEDAITGVEYTVLNRAAGFTEAIMRRLDVTPVRGNRGGWNRRRVDEDSEQDIS